ncbi:MAG: hypothetical protein ACI3YC_03450, partial [Alloprevotella sp.]
PTRRLHLRSAHRLLRGEPTGLTGNKPSAHSTHRNFFERKMSKSLVKKSKHHIFASRNKQNEGKMTNQGRNSNRWWRRLGSFWVAG